MRILRQRHGSGGALVGVLVFALALLARGAQLSAQAGRPLERDDAEYEALGWRIANGLPYSSSERGPALKATPGNPTAFRTPGLPLFIAVIYAAVGREPLFARAGLVLLNAAATVALLGVALRLYGRRAGLISAVAWALWPESVTSYYASDALLAESLAVPLLIFAYRMSDGGSRAWSLATGLALGWAQLSRSYLLPISVFAVLLSVCWGTREVRSRILVICLVASLPTSLWMLRNAAVLGAPMISTQAGIALWFGHNEYARGSWNGNWETSPELRGVLGRHPELLAASEPEKSSIFTAEAWRDSLRGGVARFAWLESRKLVLYFWPFESGSGFLPALAVALLVLPLGVVLALRQPMTASCCLMGATVLGTLASVLVTFHDARYRFCAEPAIVVAAALAVATIFTARRRGDWDSPRGNASP